MNKDLSRTKTGPPPNVSNAYDPEQHTFSFHLGNVSGKDANFMGEVVGLFCDPLHAGMLDHVKHGRMCLVYVEGRLKFVPVFGKN
jgi:hypothetical protein